MQDISRGRECLKSTAKYRSLMEMHIDYHALDLSESLLRRFHISLMKGYCTMLSHHGIGLEVRSVTDPIK